MSNYPRYAVYYAPAPASDLDRFGARLLGYDACDGEELPFPEVVLQAAPDWHDLTSDPRKYGFHATLKAPFSLAKNRTEAELVAAVATFAATPRAIPIITPVVGSLSGFIAVIPVEPPQELIRLAADCVSEFDCFRAPLTAVDRERRNPSQLTLAQREHLDRWGYPYVMEEFRFHMTLTGRLGSERRETVLAMLKVCFSALDVATLAIDRIALSHQESSNSKFRVVDHWKLSAVELPQPPLSQPVEQ